MPLVGIEMYRREVARVVRIERRPYRLGNTDIDVSIFNIGQESPSSVDSKEHRRLACDARAELWRHIKAGEIHDDDQIQVYEEMSHTE